MVCCSGVGKDGSLRIVKSGIGIHEAATIDLAGVKGTIVCNLLLFYYQKVYGHYSVDTIVMDMTTLLFYHLLVTLCKCHIILSDSICNDVFSILSLNGEEVEETELPGIATDQQTFYCANVNVKSVLQVPVN